MSLPPVRPLHVPGVRAEALSATHRILTLARTRAAAQLKRPRDLIATLAFSCGKDSVIALAVLRHYFPTVLPCYWYLVPHLRMMDEAITYYERRFKVSVHQLPHPDRFLLLKTWTFQPPDRLTILDEWMGDVPDYTMDDLLVELRKRWRLPSALPHAVGLRASDSPQRLALIRKGRGFAENGQTFYPLAEWRIADIEAALDHWHLKLPADYAWYGRSFDGLMYRYVLPLRQHYPDDWARICADFPLAELEFRRRAMADKHFSLNARIPVYKFVGDTHAPSRQS